MSLLAGLTACGSLPAARMALPEPLAAQRPVLIEGLGGGRSGSFTVDGTPGRFERDASRLALLGNALADDRASARYTFAPDTARAVATTCRARQTVAQLGAVGAAIRPYRVQCDVGGAFSAQLVMEALSRGAGARAEREGQVTAGGTTLQLRSVHRVEGSPLSLEAPIGFLFLHEGRPVGAVEVNGTPRIWRPAAGTPLHDAVTHAALSLAVLWDPALN